MDLNYFKTTCQVCGGEGNGQHFGVETCRACAAFFKRSKNLSNKFICKKDKHCNLRKSSCRFCRYKQCVELGMSISSTSKTSFDGPGLLVAETKEKIRYEERVEYCVRHPVTNKPVKWIDVEPIVRWSREILENFCPPLSEEYKKLNALQLMTYSLRRLRSSQSQFPCFKKFIKFDEYFTLWELNMTRAAEWMMHCAEFRQLPNHEKMSVFKLIWAVWRRVERSTMCARVFGERCYEEEIVLLSDDTAIRMQEFGMDVTDIYDKGFDKYYQMLGKCATPYLENVVKPFLNWKFTDEEVVFALCQIVWNYAARKLCGQTQVAAEKFLGQISDDLHKYYTEELNMTNYAHRLAGIMEMVNNVLKTQMEHEKVMEMVFLFDTLTVLFSDSKFFSV